MKNNAQATSIVIRSAVEADLPRLLAIEESAHVYAWPEYTLRWSLNQQNFCIRVLEQQGEITGFAIFECVLDEATLLNLAIDPAAQNHGFGRTLLRDGLRALDQKITRVLLEVRESNASARHLYRSEGFVEIAVREDYYPTFSGRENAHVLELFVSKP